jgi:hypothetical protein
MAISLLSAPTNLGLRPPVATATPGCAKAPEVLRAAGIYTRLDAADAGLVVCPRYADDAAPGRLRNQDAILDCCVRSRPVRSVRTWASTTLTSTRMGQPLASSSTVSLRALPIWGRPANLGTK